MSQADRSIPVKTIPSRPPADSVKVSHVCRHVPICAPRNRQVPYSLKRELMRTTPQVFVILALAGILNSGCGTLLYSGTSDVMINSRPGEALVIYNGEIVGETPAIITLPNGESSHQIIVRKDGYETGSCVITRRYNLKVAAMDYAPGVLGSIAPFGLTVSGILWLVSSGAAVTDFLNGSLFKLSQDSCTIGLFVREK